MELRELDAEISAQLDAVLAVDPSGLSQSDLADHTLRLEALRCKVDAIQVRTLAAAAANRVQEVTRHRRTSLWFADETGLGTGVATSRIQNAKALLAHAPLVWAAYVNGDVTEQHVRRVAHVARDARFAAQLTQDQNLFLKWAKEKWPVFTLRVRNWEAIWDRTDPVDLIDAIANVHDQRSLTISKGLEDRVHLELDTDTIIGDQIETAVDAVYQRMFTQDWEWAREQHGDKVCVALLPRTRKQRMHDALAEVIRAGYGHADPGANVVTNVLLDQRTITDAAEYTEGIIPQQRPSSDAEHMRCETLGGGALSPQLALAYVLAGQLRAMKLSGVTLEASRKKRTFQGLQRLMIMIRDRHCTAGGCGTPSHRCQADHTQPHSEGGLTADDNGKPLCAPCHRFKTWLESHGLKPPNPRA